jgi:CMP/dCMP kinase
VTAEDRARGLVIAIDGPSGAGKSTAGRSLAVRLGYLFVDTGAMYRALALKALRLGIAPDDEARLVELAREALIELGREGTVGLDGEDVTHAIRTRDVSLLASQVSVHTGVRREMVARQRRLGASGGVVLDGRDIGTAVFPDADVKFYLDADPRCRALRRHQELAAAGARADLPTIEAEIRARDHADITRGDSPLVRAPDAVPIETDGLDPQGVVEAMFKVVEARKRSRPTSL